MTEQHVWSRTFYQALAVMSPQKARRRAELAISLYRGFMESPDMRGWDIIDIAVPEAHLSQSSVPS